MQKGADLRRSLLAIQKLAHAATGTLSAPPPPVLPSSRKRVSADGRVVVVHRSGAAHGLRQQTHALSLEAVLAKCPQIGGKGELQYHEVADGLCAPCHPCKP